ncbi:unnamed protein product [Amoebophrya sp. A120]|nr:unnamed protein product [Amoebophrya sp. A120]|eukprot:GSA120T00011590001.1
MPPSLPRPGRLEEQNDFAGDPHCSTTKIIVPVNFTGTTTSVLGTVGETTGEEVVATTPQDDEPRVFTIKTGSLKTLGGGSISVVGGTINVTNIPTAPASLVPASVDTAKDAGAEKVIPSAAMGELAATAASENRETLERLNLNKVCSKAPEELLLVPDKEPANMATSLISPKQARKEDAKAALKEIESEDDQEPGQHLYQTREERKGELLLLVDDTDANTFTSSLNAASTSHHQLRVQDQGEKVEGEPVEEAPSPSSAAVDLDVSVSMSAKNELYNFLKTCAADRKPDISDGDIHAASSSTAKSRNESAAGPAEQHATGAAVESDRMETNALDAEDEAENEDDPELLKQLQEMDALLPDNIFDENGDEDDAEAAAHYVYAFYGAAAFLDPSSPVDLKAGAHIPVEEGMDDEHDIKKLNDADGDVQHEVESDVLGAMERTETETMGKQAEQDEGTSKTNAKRPRSRSRSKQNENQKGDEVPVTDSLLLLTARENEDVDTFMTEDVDADAHQHEPATKSQKKAVEEVDKVKDREFERSHESNRASFYPLLRATFFRGPRLRLERIEARTHLVNYTAAGKYKTSEWLGQKIKDELRFTCAELSAEKQLTAGVPQFFVTGEMALIDKIVEEANEQIFQKAVAALEVVTSKNITAAGLPEEKQQEELASFFSAIPITKAPNKSKGNSHSANYDFEYGTYLIAAFQQDRRDHESGSTAVGDSSQEVEFLSDNFQSAFDGGRLAAKINAAESAKNDAGEKITNPVNKQNSIPKKILRVPTPMKKMKIQGKSSASSSSTCNTSRNSSSSSATSKKADKMKKSKTNQAKASSAASKKTAAVFGLKSNDADLSEKVTNTTATAVSGQGSSSLLINKNPTSTDTNATTLKGLEVSGHEKNTSTSEGAAGVLAGEQGGQEREGLAAGQGKPEALRFYPSIPMKIIKAKMGRGRPKKTDIAGAAATSSTSSSSKTTLKPASKSSSSSANNSKSAPMGVQQGGEVEIKSGGATSSSGSGSGSSSRKVVTSSTVFEDQQKSGSSWSSSAASSSFDARVAKVAAASSTGCTGKHYNWWSKAFFLLLAFM